MAKTAFFSLMGITAIVVFNFFFSKDIDDKREVTVTVPLAKPETQDIALPKPRQSTEVFVKAPERQVARNSAPVPEEEFEKGADPEMKAKREAEEREIHRWRSLPEKAQIQR